MFFFCRCKLCNKKYVSQFTLTDHMKQHDTNFTRFHCQKCPKSFVKKTSLTFHLRIGHATDEEKGFPCKDCPKR